MKRLLFILLMVLSFTQITNAAEHLKFMGIPLTGTINAFQTKLAAKGVSVSKINKYVSKGARAFSGKFAGEEAIIYVFYNEKTNIVYRAKAVISVSGDNIRENKYNDFQAMLLKKYSLDYSEEGESEDYPTVSIFVTDNFGEAYLGHIDLFQSKDEYSYDAYTIHIDYWDATNDTANDNSRMQDL